MKFALRVLAGAIALATVTTASEAATSASIDRQFRNAVANILNSVRNGNDYLGGLSNAEFKAFVSCAQGVMDAAPLARKQYVLAAPNATVQRQRFDEVSLDNRAALKQKITRECAT
jgi:hypothetical protein